MTAIPADVADFLAPPVQRTRTPADRIRTVEEVEAGT